jgi:hypothetical protein
MAVMNMKSILFAGLGLFVVMTATVLLMRGDVQRMKEEAAAKRAAECAVQPAPAAPATDPSMADPMAAPAAPTAADPGCAPTPGAANAPVADQYATTTTPAGDYAAPVDTGQYAAPVDAGQYAPPAAPAVPAAPAADVVGGM